MASDLVSRTARRATSPLRTYFNSQFEATKDEVRAQTALQSDALSAAVMRALDEQTAQLAHLAAQIDRLDGRVGDLAASLADLVATHDQMLAVLASGSKRPDGPPDP